MNKYVDAYNTMGNSGNEILDFIFKICVIFLVDLAEVLGISYEAINIMIIQSVLYRYRSLGECKGISDYPPYLFN